MAQRRIATAPEKARLLTQQVKDEQERQHELQFELAVLQSDEVSLKNRISDLQKNKSVRSHRHKWSRGNPTRSCPLCG